MENTPRIRSLYAKIQTQLFYMIPEKWEKIYLYASVVEKANNVQTGEMFFYYFPKGILKKNPINVYEIPYLYNIDEEAYNVLTNKLYETIKELRNEFKKAEMELWSNLTISIANLKFEVVYNYEDLEKSEYTSEERRIIWNYRYLKFPIERFSKRERKMIEKYLAEEYFSNVKIEKYSEGMYNFKVHNIIEYNKEENVPDKSENEVKAKKQEIDENMDFETRHKKLDKYEIYKRQKEEKEKRKNQEFATKKIENNIEESQSEAVTKSQILNFWRYLERYLNSVLLIMLYKMKIYLETLEYK